MLSASAGCREEGKDAEGEAKHTELWGVVASEDDDKLYAHVQHLAQQVLRTTTVHRDSFKDLIAQMCQSQGCNFGALDYRDADELSLDEFNSKYAAVAQPCMVRGCTAQWRAAERWKSAQALATWHGNVPIRITEVREGGHLAPLRMPLSKYLSYAEADSGGADFPWYDDHQAAGIMSRCTHACITIHMDTHARTHAHTHTHTERETETETETEAEAEASRQASRQAYMLIHTCMHACTRTYIHLLASTHTNEPTHPRPHRCA